MRSCTHAPAKIYFLSPLSVPFSPIPRAPAPGSDGIGGNGQRSASAAAFEKVYPEIQALAALKEAAIVESSTEGVCYLESTTVSVSLYILEVSAAEREPFYFGGKNFVRRLSQQGAHGAPTYGDPREAP
eukprot:Skav200636  [mRNA]  locus=scaffold353:177505:179733:+ [translate_table: standard]